MKVIFDNNVLISAALLKHSVPFMAFSKAINKHILLRSHEALNEFRNTLFRTKFDRYFIDDFARENFLLSFIVASIDTDIIHKVNICRDPKDNMYLELALSGKADLIITGDSDLLVLHPFCNIPVITPKLFIDSF